MMIHNCDQFGYQTSSCNRLTFETYTLVLLFPFLIVSLLHVTFYHLGPVMIFIMHYSAEYMTALVNISRHFTIILVIVGKWQYH